MKINRQKTQYKVKAHVYAKRESLDPGYSVKDRIGLSTIDRAEKKAAGKPKGDLVLIPVRAGL